MRHGFILSLSLYLMLIISLLVSSRVDVVKSLQDLEEKSVEIYQRLACEREVFDEILFNLSVYLTDDFEFNTAYYTYFVKIQDEDVSIDVYGREEYSIKLKYNDDCICFMEILYD